MRVCLAALASLLVATPALAQDMARDIAAIQTACPSASFSKAVDLVSCEDSFGRAVMLRYDARDVDLFDVAASDRITTARDVDAGRVTLGFAAQRFQYIANDLGAAIQKRRQSAATKRELLNALAEGLKAYGASRRSVVPPTTTTDCTTISYYTTCTTR